MFCIQPVALVWLSVAVVPTSGRVCDIVPRVVQTLQGESSLVTTYSLGLQWSLMLGTHALILRSRSSLAVPDTNLGRQRSLSTISLDGDADNFWDVNGYKPVLKRIGGGAKLCDQLAKMLKER